MAKGGDGDNTIWGGEGHDDLSGGWDDDEIEGGDGDDTISGGRDADLLLGEDGDDKLNGGGHDDHITLGHGWDTADGGASNDTFVIKGFGNNIIHGGTGVDTAEFGNAAVTVNLLGQCDAQRRDRHALHDRKRHHWRRQRCHHRKQHAKRAHQRLRT